MTPNEMSLDQCRDWLAREDGWTYESWAMSPVWGKDGKFSAHPYPPTIDGAAGAMPEGWCLYISTACRREDSDDLVRAKAEHDTSFAMEIVEAPTELLARYRLAVACRQAMKGTP